MVSYVLGTAIAFSGLLCLGLAFHLKREWSGLLAVPGWALLGLFFTLGTQYYVDLGDPTLVVMSAAALPAGLAIGVWEVKLFRERRTDAAVLWLRGAVFWAGLPYLAIERVPYANAAAVWLIAWQTVLYLRFAGITHPENGGITLGEMQVSPEGAAPIPWSSWEGNRWLLTEPLSEHGIYLPLEYANGEPVLINFVLACTALQSMIVFVGAIAALKAPWRRRVRALLVAIPTIHVLNVFRNAGIIWLQMRYARSFSLFGLDMFDFSHSYAAKVGALFAMFLMALVLFELLPDLHRHVLKLLDPVLAPLGLRLLPAEAPPRGEVETAAVEADAVEVDAIEVAPDLADGHPSAAASKPA